MFRSQLPGPQGLVHCPVFSRAVRHTAKEQLVRLWGQTWAAARTVGAHSVRSQRQGRGNKVREEEINVETICRGRQGQVATRGPPAGVDFKGDKVLRER